MKPATVDLTTVDALDLAVSYLRVSSKKQLDTAHDIDRDGNSIATQRDYIDRKASNLAARVVKEFFDPGISAQTIDKRREFQDLIEYLKQNPDIKYVIVYARSRAFRNYIDAAITKRLLDKLGVKLVSAREDFGDGIFAEAMEAMTDIFNDVQNKLSGEDIRLKMRNKAIKGGTIGVAKLGYRNARVEIEGRQVNTIQLDEQRAPLVLRAFELYATGEYSIDRLEATMADLGLTSRRTPRHPGERPVAASTLHKMLTDPYYLGYVVYKGEKYPGRHPAIVGQELFERVQDVFNTRSAEGQRDRVLMHYLKGALFCDRCASEGRTSRFIYVEAKGRTGKRYGYFLCRGRQEKVCDMPHLPVDLVEQAIVDHYHTLELPVDFIESVRQRLEGAVSNEQAATHTMHANLKKRLKEIDKQENRLLDLAADGAMPQAKIRAKLLDLAAERERVETGLSATSRELGTGATALRHALHLVADPHSLYRDVTDSARRHLNQTFFRRIFLDDTRVTHDEKTPVFQEIIEAKYAYQSRPVPATIDADQRYERSPRDARASSGSAVTDLPTLARVYTVSGSSRPVMVGMTGFEPATLRSQSGCATKLRYIPIESGRRESNPHHQLGRLRFYH